ncbi:MAG: hypothetical protein ACREEQ_09740 [Caulobacteraceae bacterium]
MDADSLRTYPPLGALKPVTEDVWVVDGPLVRFGPPGLKMAFSTRMTLIRLSGGLFVHSPTPLALELKAAAERLAPPRWIVGPNRIHYSWIGEWALAYPQAEVYLAPKIAQQAGRGFDVAGRPLVAERGYPWDDELRTLVVEGSYMSEAVFFHLASPHWF